MTPDLSAHLRAHGLVAAHTPLLVEALDGGVSNDVLAVTGPGVDFVVKRALARLRVSEEWHADPARIAIEARATLVAARISPGLVPRVVDFHDGYLVLERVPRDWTNWRDDLLSGDAASEVTAVAIADRLGTELAAIHGATRADPDMLAQFADRSPFEQLRVEPFYLVARDRNPDLADRIDATVATMLATRTCLVHGDFSPKNILVHGTDVVVLDWEVAHAGDPSFDVAFMLAHLILKAVHRPDAVATMAACAERLQSGYGGGLPPQHLGAQVGCLLLARVDGKSPAPYLTDAGRQRTRDIARTMLTDDTAIAADAWRYLS